MHTIFIALYTFAVVMGVMALLTCLLAGLRWAAGWHRPQQVEEADGSDGLPDEEIVAVLGAAARAALGGPVRIHHVHVHRERRLDVWGRVGRIDVLGSHRVVPKR